MTWREIEAWDARLRRGEITQVEWLDRYWLPGCPEVTVKQYVRAKLIGTVVYCGGLVLLVLAAFLICAVIVKLAG